MERTVHAEQGAIAFTLKRSRRRRTVALRVDPSGAVVVYAPSFAWNVFIDRFVREQAAWIAQKLAQFKQLAERHPRREFAAGHRFPVWGAETPLESILPAQTLAEPPRVVQAALE